MDVPTKAQRRQSPKTDPAHPSRVRGAANRKDALDLRLRGMSYAEIGRRLGVTRQTAHEHVMVALREAAAQCAANAVTLRAMETERLEFIYSRLMKKLERGDPVAANAAVRVSTRLAALHGLDAPTKQEHSGPSGGPIVVDSMASVLARGQAHIAALRAQETAPAPVLPSGELAKKE